MAAPSCIPHFRSKRFATKVVDKLSAEQLQKYGITNDASRNDAIKAIQALAERYLNAEPDQDKKDQMEQNIDGFISDLDKHFSVVKVSEDNFEKAEQQYKEFGKFCVEWKTGRLGNFEFQNTKEDQEDATAVEAILLEYADVVTYMVEKHPNNKIKSISFILLEPQKSDTKTAQQKTVDTINKIRGLSQIEIYNTRNKKETMFVDSQDDIPEGWRPTGQYLYEGKTVRAKGVTKEIDDSDYTGPVLAGPIGTTADRVGRTVFNRDGVKEGTHPLYNKDGKLKDPKKDKEELQEFIDENLQGAYTVQGLINLAKDFLELEKQLKGKWGDDIVIISEETRLFGKKEDGSWIVGYPDLLVIDKEGIIHTIDFKTSKIKDIKGYVNVFHDENEEKYHTGEHYGKQITRYIRMEESYGLPVDLNPYVVLIDTWYDASDTVKTRKEGQDALYQTEGTLGILDNKGNLTMSFGEYADQNPLSRQDLLLPNDAETGIAAKKILYMEPRLHLNIEEENGSYTYSEELAALRDKKDIPFDNDASYEQQWAALSDDEKRELQWLFNAKPIVVKTAQGIVTLSKDDIESNPELISSQEIQDVAEFIMYRVSRIITDLQKGIGYDAIPDIMADEEGPSTVYSA